MEKLKILLPKGRIYDNVVELFNGAGISIKLPERAYRPTVNQDDLEAKVMKPQNIGKLLELGAHDVGFTGRDWIEETSADVEEIMDLGFDKVRIVAAVPNAIDDNQLKYLVQKGGIFGLCFYPVFLGCRDIFENIYKNIKLLALFENDSEVTV